MRLEIEREFRIVAELETAVSIGIGCTLSQVISAVKIASRTTHVAGTLLVKPRFFLHKIFISAEGVECGIFFC